MLFRLTVVLLVLSLPAPALAAPDDVACVGVSRADCTTTPDTLQDALASHAHLIRLGPGPFTGAITTADPVELAGTDGTVIRAQPRLVLDAPAALHNLRVEGTLEANAAVTLDDVDLSRLEIDEADVTGRGVTVAGRAVLDGGSLALTSSLVGGDDPFAVADEATVTTAYSAHAADEDATATDRADAPADPRAPGDAALVDRGDPAALAPFEPFEDAAGYPRVAGGRRDIGAYETQPSPVPIAPSSVLVNGGAEDGLTGWSGGFAAPAYGDPFLPTVLTGRALGGGARFFAAAGEAAPTLSQRIDVAGAAASIDAGIATATLSGLVGGYGADTDALGVRAVFKDPENRELGSLVLTPVGTAERLNDTTLLRREAGGAIPARTRAVDVMLHGERHAGGYTDAYADNLALVLSVPGLPAKTGVEDPPIPGLKPFGGIGVYTAQPRFSRKGGARFLLGCASATVTACSGSLELRATLPGQTKPARIARYATFALGHGASRHVVVRLLAKTRKRILRLRQLSATLIAVARDGQGLQRRTTIPVVLKLPGRAIRR